MDSYLTFVSSEFQRREIGIENVLKEIVAKNSPNLAKYMHRDSGSCVNSNRKNSKKFIPNHVIVKLLTNGKENNL